MDDIPTNAPKPGRIKTLIVGNGGRESSIAMKLAEDSSVYAIMKHENPSIISYVDKSGGKYLIDNYNDPEVVVNFAKKMKIDLAFISSDNPLEAGVVDLLLKEGIKTVGPTREGAEIEWNKLFAMELMEEILPWATPAFWVAYSQEELGPIFEEVKKLNMEVVIKPQGLTGGKGVKVMGKHLKDYKEAEAYAAEILNEGIGNSKCVLIVEKLEGIEFTIMALTDGKSVVYSPATYDYPFRFEGDEGPGTGGMGCFNGKKNPLPFMSDAEFEKAREIIEKVVAALRGRGRQFNGVLNSGLFLTKDGLKFMEFNARFGDPECMNIMMVLDSSLVEILKSIETQELSDMDVKFKNKASVVKYLVAPEYALSKGKPHEFRMDLEKVYAEGISVFFSSAVEENGHFKTVGTSRTVALGAADDSIMGAARRVNSAIDNYVHGNLQYRRDIGSEEELDALKRKSELLRKMK